jgi:SAM-dependent methyltransferase
MDDTDYALGRTNTEYERLIEQAALFRPLTERTLRAAGISAGMHVLDIGCGVGDVSFLVSELVGPGSSVIGVDLEGAAVRLADDRRAARAMINVVFRQADARSAHAGQLFDAAVGWFVCLTSCPRVSETRLRWGLRGTAARRSGAPRNQSGRG